ncbi:MAG: phosphatase PAP2 family protein, partial [Bacteroidaceae bacterium]|nr:phosphatase PAP2 family protein [Bacteroidaceae bacterium]
MMHNHLIRSMLALLLTCIASCVWAEESAPAPALGTSVLNVKPITLDIQLSTISPQTSPYTVTFEKDENYQKPKWYEKSVMHGLYYGLPFVAASFAFKPLKQDFRSIRNNLNSTMHVGWDDYVQYSPFAICYIMKACGVESRTSWGRMLVSHALAAASMAAVVNGLKYSIGEQRPDSEAKNSFPSGHSATAFMAATLLHREYGHISPWLSVGSYAIATATGISRLVNNRHWVPDVFFGAGIGIITGELGYYMGDLIFRDKYIRHFKREKNFDRLHKPSYLGLTVGAMFPFSPTISTTSHNAILGADVRQQVRYVTGSDVSVEGAYFATPYVGIGGSAHLTSSNISALTTVDEAASHAQTLTDILGQDYTATNCNLFTQNYMLQVYGNYSFNKLFRLQAKFGMGYSNSKMCSEEQRVSGIATALGKWYDARHAYFNADEQAVWDNANQYITQTYDGINIEEKATERGTMR